MFGLLSIPLTVLNDHHSGKYGHVENAEDCLNLSLMTAPCKRFKKSIMSVIEDSV